MKKSLSKKVLSLFLVLVLVLSLSACGEKADSNEDAQGVTEDTIKVANCAATSGAYAPVGVPFNAGIEAYFEMINDQGGVHGRKIEFLHQDDEFDPGKGKACLQNMVDDEKVFAIVGHFGTPVVAATIQDLKEYGIPSVYFATGIGQLYNDKAEGEDRVIFPVQPIYITEGEIMVTRGVGNYDAKKIGIIYTNDDAGKDMLKGAEEQAKALGVELVSEQVAPAATDVSAAVTSIVKADVDFIIGASIQQTFPTIVKALAEQGNDKPVITTYVNVAPTISEAIADTIEGKFDVLGNGWVSFTEELAVKELETYQKWIGNSEYDNNAYAITGWIAGHFFTEGLKAIPEGEALSWENYMDGLEKEAIMNPFGGLIDYTDGQRKGTTVMNLSKVDKSAPTGWVETQPLQSTDEILNK